MYTSRVIAGVVCFACFALAGFTSCPDATRQPPFQMTPQEQTMWEEWAKAATAPDPQQAVKDWAARYKIRLTNQTVMNVTRRVTDGQLSAPSLKITSIALQRTMVDGVLVPPLEEVEGEPVVEAGKKCQDHCASNFEFDNLSPALVER